MKKCSNCFRDFPENNMVITKEVRPYCKQCYRMIFEEDFCQHNNNRGNNQFSDEPEIDFDTLANRGDFPLDKNGW